MLLDASPWKFAPRQQFPRPFRPFRPYIGAVTQQPPYIRRISGCMSGWVGNSWWRKLLMNSLLSWDFLGSSSELPEAHDQHSTFTQNIPKLWFHDFSLFQPISANGSPSGKPAGSVRSSTNLDITTAKTRRRQGHARPFINHCSKIMDFDISRISPFS
jgi:hypothetical protein